MRRSALLIALMALNGAAAVTAQSRPDSVAQPAAAEGEVREAPLPPPSTWVAGDSSRASAARHAGSRLGNFESDFRAGFLGTTHTVLAPMRWSERQWLYLPAGTVVLAALTRLDQPVHRLVDRNRTAGLDQAARVVEPMGEKGAIGLVVGTYMAGLVMNRPAWRRVGVEAATSSVVAAGLVTPGLKLLVGRSRPWAGRGPYAFHSMSGQESFPSGHTTQAFAAASVFAAEARPLPAKIAAYALASAVASARMIHDAHFLSDVVAGATIGTVTGRAAVHWERTHPGSWQPYVGPEGVGVRRLLR